MTSSIIKSSQKILDIWIRYLLNGHWLIFGRFFPSWKYFFFENILVIGWEKIEKKSAKYDHIWQIFSSWKYFFFENILVIGWEKIEKKSAKYDHIWQIFSLLKIFFFWKYISYWLGENWKKNLPNMIIFGRFFPLENIFFENILVIGWEKIEKKSAKYDHIWQIFSLLKIFFLKIY